MGLVTRYFTINGVMYSRTQFPLQNSCALTVHKTQSLGIANVTVSLDASFFSVGQAYTALSRAISLDRLSIMHLDREAFKVDEEAVRQHRSLEEKWRAFVDRASEFMAEKKWIHERKLKIKYIYCYNYNKG